MLVYFYCMQLNAVYPTAPFMEILRFYVVHLFNFGGTKLHRQLARLLLIGVIFFIFKEEYLC